MMPTPVEYGLLCPMLIVFGVASPVLVEAFLPRQSRYAAQWS